MPPHIACDRHSPPHSAQPCSTGGKTHALRLITWPPTTAFTTTAASLPLTHCPCCRHHRKPQPFRPRPCSCTCCRVLLAVKCARTCAHTYLHIKWDSKGVRTPPLTSVLHYLTSRRVIRPSLPMHYIGRRAPRSETWSVGCLLLFDLEAGSRDRLHVELPNVNEENFC